MEKLDRRMADAWRQAAADLGLRLTTPFNTKNARGDAIELEGFLPDFGGPSGIVFVSYSRRIQPAKIGLHGSVLFEAYRKYERAMFVDTLNDWGWYGAPANRPHWYTGEAWT